jgi:polyisoprenoid-binding protein YceI
MRLTALCATLVVASTLATAAQAADAVPPASKAPVPRGAYEIDKAHTSLVFKVAHLGFSTFTGRFTRFDAKLTFDPRNLASSSVNVTIDPTSVSSDNAPAGFLEEVAGTMFLDAGKFPQMAFTSRSVEDAGGGRFRIRGELTLHGVTRPLTLEGRYNGGYAGHPFDPHARVGFSAHGTLKRSDFGITMGIPSAENHFFGVGDEVGIQLETEFSGPPLEVASR